MEIPFNAIVKSENETRKIAEEFSEILHPGDVVALKGNLGAGKTFFVKNACKKFNVNNANSPSFAIVNEYMGAVNIYHFDFYRIKKPVELYDIGFDEYLIQQNSIVFIEWPDLVPEVLPENRYDVQFEFIDDNSRKITITKHE